MTLLQPQHLVKQEEHELCFMFIPPLATELVPRAYCCLEHAACTSLACKTAQRAAQQRGKNYTARDKEVHHVMQVLKRVTTITIRTVMVTATFLCRKKSALNPIPKPYILNPNPQILNPKPYTQTLHPKTQALNPKLEPLRPKLQALNPTCSIALGFRA